MRASELQVRDQADQIEVLVAEITRLREKNSSAGTKPSALVAAWRTHHQSAFARSSTTSASFAAIES